MIYFYNLTNGLEVKITDLNQHPHLVRIQSSHVESKAWDRLFQQLSDELLFYLAIGEQCIIIDGSPNPNHSHISRIAVPVIQYVLTRLWLKEKLAPAMIDDEYLERIYRSLDQSTKRKLKYYRKFLLTDEVKLNCYVFPNCKDGKYDWFKEKIKERIKK